LNTWWLPEVALAAVQELTAQRAAAVPAATEQLVDLQLHLALRLQ
jgi:hypothetical protein